MAFFAASAYAAIELQIVAYHGYAGERIGAVANEGCAFYGVLDFAVFYPPGLAGREYKFAAGNVYLPAAKVGGIQAAFEAGNNGLRVFVACEHIGVGHARNGGAGVAFAPAVACGFAAHEACVGAVLQVARQNAVFNQHGALCGRAFVVNVQAAAPTWQSAVIKHGYAFGGYALAHAACKGAAAFAVEVAFQPMAYGFVQQHAGPAIAQHHVHHASGGGLRLQVGQGGVYGFIYIMLQQGIIKIIQPKAPAATAAACFALHFACQLLLGNDCNAQAHQRAHVSRQRAIEPRHQHHVVLRRYAGHDLLDARVFGARHFLDALKQGNFGGAVKADDGVKSRIQVARSSGALFGRGGGLPFAAFGCAASRAVGAANGAHVAHRIHQGGLRDVV